MTCLEEALLVVGKDELNSKERSVLICCSGEKIADRLDDLIYQLINSAKLA